MIHLSGISWYCPNGQGSILNSGLRILGIDPGTATTGYGIIELCQRNTYRYLGSGIIQTSKNLSMPERLKIIREDVLSLIDNYQPENIAIESIFFFKNAKTLVPVAQARGVILEAAGFRSIPLAEYTPMQVKMSVAGYGKAEKKEIQYIVAKLLNHSTIIRPDDAADAVAIAICHARNRFATPGTTPSPVTPTSQSSIPVS